MHDLTATYYRHKPSCECKYCKAICKRRHWKLGIGIGIGNGIGIGTDITNAIISSSVRSMNPKLSRVVT